MAVGKSQPEESQVELAQITLPHLVVTQTKFAKITPKKEGNPRTGATHKAKQNKNPDQMIVKVLSENL